MKRIQTDEENGREFFNLLRNFLLKLKNHEKSEKAIKQLQIAFSIYLGLAVSRLFANFFVCGFWRSVEITADKYLSNNREAPQGGR